MGWIAHYMIGITFAIAFVGLVGNNWLQHPMLISAIVFGVVTVLMPFFIMQPAFGLGFAASKTSNPMQARICSLMNYTAFPGTALARTGVAQVLSFRIVGQLVDMDAQPNIGPNLKHKQTESKGHLCNLQLIISANNTNVISGVSRIFS